jgi:hypothetical protein
VTVASYEVPAAPDVASSDEPELPGGAVGKPVDPAPDPPHPSAHADMPTAKATRGKTRIILQILSWALWVLGSLG